MHKIEGAHVQCVNNNFAKFENKEMKTVGNTDYTNQTPSKAKKKNRCVYGLPTDPVL